MSTKTDENSRIKFTTIVRKYPSFRDDAVKGVWKWLEGRCEDDNAEGYWRVHDKLYDLKEFAKNHPGGSEWIRLTKGTDITEAFESYHILPKASIVLKQFYVKDADDARNYLLTYKDDGFYRVLKSRVAEMLPTLDRSDLWKSKMCVDAIVLGLFVASILAMKCSSILGMSIFILIASQFAGWLNAASHNFIHQRNNWRMYTANLVLTGWRDWRVYHGLSHHLYPNSYSDYEISAYEPWLRWIPVQKRTKLGVFISYVFSPIVYGYVFHSVFTSRLIGAFLAKRRVFFWDELIALTLPLAMFIFGKPEFTIRNIIFIYIIWGIILAGGSFLYNTMAISAGHHGYDITHEGDEFKSLDYGIYQMSATVDRIEANKNIVMSMTHFGDHTLHHLFPSLDHSLLPQLREVYFRTCKDFDVELKELTLWQALVEQFKQLSRDKVKTL